MESTAAAESMHAASSESNAVKCWASAMEGVTASEASGRCVSEARSGYVARMSMETSRRRDSGRVITVTEVVICATPETAAPTVDRSAPNRPR